MKASNSPADAASAPLCGHAAATARRGYRAECPSCGSFWDTDHWRSPFAYDESYLRRRLHDHPAVGRAKAASLDLWLARCGIDPSGKTACEVGFGAGSCLRRLQERGADPFGIEATPTCLARARESGIPEERLFDAARLPERLPRSVDLWLFADSFEHLPRPAEFLSWARRNSSSRARAIVVAPRADSWSNRLMGRWWPHKLPDHPFHWSQSGLAHVFARHGFELTRTFYPFKWVTLATALAHWAHLHDEPSAGARILSAAAGGLARIALPLNFGEMGHLYEARA